MEVSLFVTCLTDTFYPRAGIATVKVLEHLGCDVDFPQAQTCCGQPFWNNGYADETRRLAEGMIRAFEHGRTVVTPSGSCAAMIREYYPEMFEGDHAWEHAAEDLAGRTREFVEFLVKDLDVDLSEYGVKWDGDVTYHYSCHLRGIGVKDEAVSLLEQIEGVNHTPLEKRDQCCGFGGTFAMKFSDVSGNLVRDKVDCIGKTGAPTVVSNDAGCTMNISGACRRENQSVGFKHIAEVIAEGMGLLPRQETPVTGEPKSSGGDA
ncbi:MAG: (Fe-S)-binding protein [Phycisphaeraceae bacterium]|nr:(Fe-S)-binding protein [Phycisphaeraceae bacterium]